MQLRRSVYETYQSDLARSEEDLFKGMESACRRCIRKAEKSGVTVEEAGDLAFADEYYEQLKDVFAKQGKLPTYPVERVRVLMKHMLPTGRLLALRARDPEGRCIATGLYPGMNDMAFFWGNASWRSGQQWRPNEDPTGMRCGIGRRAARRVSIGAAAARTKRSTASRRTPCRGSMRRVPVLMIVLRRSPCALLHRASAWSDVSTAARQAAPTP